MREPVATILIVAVACVAGAVAAVSGGVVEEVLDLLFVGPLLIVGLALVLARLRARRSRPL